MSFNWIFFFNFVNILTVFCPLKPQSHTNKSGKLTTNGFLKYFHIHWCPFTSFSHPENTFLFLCNVISSKIHWQFLCMQKKLTGQLLLIVCRTHNFCPGFVLCSSSGCLLAVLFLFASFPPFHILKMTRPNLSSSLIKSCIRYVKMTTGQYISIRFLYCILYPVVCDSTIHIMNYDVQFDI